MESVASVRFVIAANKLISCFNVDMLFQLNFFKFENNHYYICYIGGFLYRIYILGR